MKIITHYTKQPGGDCWTASPQFLSGHTLVAGITGSGKSVFINRMLGDALARTPANYQLILIDPKRVELYRYKATPFCVAYADEPQPIIDALDRAIEEIDRRYKVMRRKGADKWSGGALVVVVDELADLMTTQRKQALPRLQRIAQVGRAACVYLLAATQSPSRKTIPAELTLNFQNRVALHVAQPIESRQIIGNDLATTLPAYGAGYWLKATGELLHIPAIPMIDPAELQRRIDFWKDRRNRGKTRHTD